MPSLTVAEALHVSALLRLPTGMPKSALPHTLCTPRHPLTPTHCRVVSSHPYRRTSSCHH
jgi:hypothetical protein